MKAKLTAPHIYKDGTFLEIGTVVGEGSSFPDIKVSLNMEGLDEASKKLIAEHVKKAEAKGLEAQLKEPPK